MNTAHIVLEGKFQLVLFVSRIGKYTRIETSPYTRVHVKHLGVGGGRAIPNSELIEQYVKELYRSLA